MVISPSAELEEVDSNVPSRRERRGDIILLTDPCKLLELRSVDLNKTSGRKTIVQISQTSLNHANIEKIIFDL